MHNYPATAKFLTEKERSFIQRRLASDSDATHDERFSWENVVKALKDPKCWLYGLSFHTMSSAALHVLAVSRTFMMLRS